VNRTDNFFGPEMSNVAQNLKALASDADAGRKEFLRKWTPGADRVNLADDINGATR
jgi:hypothetical protein